MGQYATWYADSGLLCPFLWEELGPHLNNIAWAKAYLRAKWHPDPSNRLATIHQRHYRQDNGPIA